MGSFIEDVRTRRARCLECGERFVERLSCLDLGDGSVAPSSEGLDRPASKMAGIPLVAIGSERVYMDPADTHSIVVGSTGSKKTRLVALPAVHLLARGGESMIISDPKGEIYESSSGFLKSCDYEIDVVDFRNPSLGCGWNPLSLPYSHYLQGNMDRCYELTHDMVMNFIKIDKGSSDPFWDNSAGTLFYGLALLLFELCVKFELGPESANLRNLYNLRLWMLGRGSTGNSSRAGGNALKSLLWDVAVESPEAYSNLRIASSRAPETNDGILSVFDSKMFFLKISPAINEMMSQGHVDVAKLRRKPSAIFLIYPDEKTVFHNLISLFIKQSYEQLIAEAQNPDKGSDVGNRLRVNYILDEFSSLPAISDFPAMITAGRSRDIRFNLLIQSRHQLKLRYGEEAETIMANCSNWVFLRSREVEFLKDVSTLCGEYKSDEVRKPVLSVSDLQRLEKERGEALVLQSSCKPYLSVLLDIKKYPSAIMPAAPVPEREDTSGFDTDLEKALLNATSFASASVSGSEDVSVSGPASVEVPLEESSLAPTGGMSTILVSLKAAEEAASRAVEIQVDAIEAIGKTIHVVKEVKNETLDPADEAILSGRLLVSSELLVNYGTNAYQSRSFGVAESLFLAALSLSPSSSSARNNLAFMKRRGETSNAVQQSAESILSEGDLSRVFPFAAMNHSLCLAQDASSRFEWEEAISILQKCEDRDFDEVLGFWSDVDNVGELESCIALLLLERAGLFSPDGRKAERERILREAGVNIFED